MMVLYLVRHGETEWTRHRRHTGSSDIPLTDRGREQARVLKAVLAPLRLSRVYCSPMIRARETAELAGLGQGALVTSLIREYDYGDYEGLTTAQIRQERPDWDLWRDGCPGGESPSEVMARALGFLERLGAGSSEACAIFSHGHLLRVLTAAYLGLSADLCRHLILEVASISVLDQEHGFPAIRSWDVTSGSAQPG